ncbi:MAG: ATP-binding cassette domain-containing protein [Candidatus Deferrimicrobium sp.]
MLLGPSGSGKSTLLNILGGLDTATAGTVEYRGQELTRATDRELTSFRRRRDRRPRSAGADQPGDRHHHGADHP